MWSCRRCTLDNYLQEEVCGACGGSRLSSIGDIDIPRMFECQEVMEMIQKVEKHPDVNNDQFKVNKRLSKIIDDNESEKVEKLINYTANRKVVWIVVFICFLVLFFFL